MVILIAEDTPEIAELMSLILIDEGHSVIHKENGKLAFEYLQNENICDLLITDWFMPVMDGAELVAFLRLDHRFKALPIIVCSGSHGFDSYKPFLEASCKFIAKPFDINSLLDAVKGTV